MIEGVATLAGLLLAGYGWGRLRSKRPSSARPARSRRVRWGMVGALIVGLPMGLLLLAQLINSDVLGWIFGLSLMFGLALLPFVAIFMLGRWLGAKSSNQPMRQDASMSTLVPASMLHLRVDRDSVHPSDDAQSHAQTVDVDPGLTVAGLLSRLRAAGYLPSISGGRATWILESAADPSMPIAVCAQQWPEPRLLPLPSDTLGGLLLGRQPALHFKYWCQADPDLVFARLASGGELPSRHQAVQVSTTA
ncbi:MAG: hypothetical protein HY021_15445 [Burkholderiales bacterium]|nr:hypothetical protein [Burkholderiales bacterium]